MAELLQKIGPIAVVSLVFSWCCWPYITGSATAIGGAKGGNSIKLPNGLLSPGVKEENDRDPFQIVKNAAMNLLQAQATPEKTTDEASTVDGAQPGEKTAAAGSPFVLTGVFIRGDNRMAILNGTLRRVGDSVPGPEGGKLWTVKKISSNSIALKRGRQSRVIKMSFPSRSPEATPETPEGETPTQTGGQQAGAAPDDSRRQHKAVLTLDELLDAVRERK